MYEDGLDLRVVTPPAVEPVDLAAAKLHCRVDADAEDATISGLIAAARAHVEDVTGRALVTRTLEMRLDAWPARLYLPMPPAISVVSVTAVDADGASTVVDTDAYALRSYVDTGCVIFNSALLPAVTLADFAGVRVRYTAGYGAASNVPKPLIQAMLLLIGHWFANREAVTTASLAPAPMAVDALIAPYRLFWFGEWAQ